MAMRSHISEKGTMERFAQGIYFAIGFFFAKAGIVGLILGKTRIGNVKTVFEGIPAYVISSFELFIGFYVLNIVFPLKGEKIMKLLSKLHSLVLFRLIILLLLGVIYFFAWGDFIHIPFIGGMLSKGALSILCLIGMSVLAVSVKKRLETFSGV